MAWWLENGWWCFKSTRHSLIDLLTTFGRPLSAVTQVSNKSNKLQAEDIYAGLIKFKNFSCSVLLTTALRPKDLDASIEIFTDKQIIKLHGYVVTVNISGNQSLKQKMVSKNIRLKLHLDMVYHTR